MATWSDFVAYIRSRHTIALEADGQIAIVVVYGDGRSQMVLLTRKTAGREWAGAASEWVQIESAVAPLNQIRQSSIDSIWPVLYALGTQVVGGLVAGTFGGEQLLILRHSLCLTGLRLDGHRVEEIEGPFAFIAETADDIEKMLVGTDKL